MYVRLDVGKFFMITLSHAIILGIIQGITEWLPISSEGISSLVMVIFLKKSFAEAISISVWLHLGTFFSAVVYFRKELKGIITSVPAHVRDIKNLSQDNVLVFLLVSTFATGLLGLPLLLLSINKLGFAGENAMLAIGIFLVISGIIQLRVHKKRIPDAAVERRKILISDSFFVGLAQALSILPGISRSGITTSFLLMRRYPADQALKLSFLMSIPAVLGAQIVLQIFLNPAPFNYPALIAVAVSFVLGLIGIHLLMRFAEKINFAFFLFFIGFASVVPFFLKLISLRFLPS